MEDKNTRQHADQEPVPPRAVSGGQRVIQPTTEILEEMKLQQTAPPVSPRPVTLPVPEVPANNQPQKNLQGSPVPSPLPQPPLPPADSPAGNPFAEPSYESSSNRVILIVRIIASVLILGALGGIYEWYEVNRNPVSLVFTIASLIVSIGIFRLREIARKIYVFY